MSTGKEGEEVMQCALCNGRGPKRGRLREIDDKAMAVANVDEACARPSGAIRARR